MLSENLREKLHEIIFEADTAAGKAFDVLLLASIILSIVAVTLESVADIAAEFGPSLQLVEWILTILFTIEYFARIISVRKASSYILSFYGLIDLAAILPTYLSLFFAGGQYLIVVRALRLLRVFRVFKLTHFVGEGDLLLRALKASKPKIIVFTFGVSSLVLILGTLMYVIEGEQHGFTSIPRGVYWAIVTLTTVGYGDITPQTTPGQALSSLVMLLGYGIIAIPTGIVTSEVTMLLKASNTQVCSNCSFDDHENDALHCKLCGWKL